MKKSGSLLVSLLLACFFETIEARCRENCENKREQALQGVALVGPFGSE
jgi:hypothetical protein